VPRKGLSGNARETRKINYLTPPSLHRLYQGNVPLSIANQALTYELYSTLFRLGDRRISSHRPLSGDYPQTTTSTTDLWIYGSMDLWIYERLRAFAACGSATSAAKAVHC
jgi:hypothetical protein